MLKVNPFPLISKISRERGERGDSATRLKKKKNNQATRSPSKSNNQVEREDEARTSARTLDFEKTQATRSPGLSLSLHRSILQYWVGTSAVLGLRRPLETITPLSTNSRIPFILVPNPNGEERIPDSESNRQPYQGKRSPKTPLVLPDVPETMS